MWVRDGVSAHTRHESENSQDVGDHVELRRRHLHLHGVDIARVLSCHQLFPPSPAVGPEKWKEEGGMSVGGQGARAYPPSAELQPPAPTSSSALEVLTSTTTKEERHVDM